MGRVERTISFVHDKTIPIQDFKASPAIIPSATMMFVRFPFSLRNVADLLHAHGRAISHDRFR